MTILAKDLKLGDTLIRSNGREYEVTRLIVSKSGKMILISLSVSGEWVGQKDCTVGTKLNIK